MYNIMISKVLSGLNWVKGDGFVLADEGGRYHETVRSLKRSFGV